MKIRNLICSIIGIMVISLFTLARADDLNKDIFVNDAWVQAMPPSQPATAAYMTIVNNSPREIILVSVSSPIAAAAEIHQMSDTNGMMKMSMVANVHIPAQGKVELKPGGFHVMLINLKKPVNKGDNVPLKLHFQEGDDIIINAQAKQNPQDGATSMPGMKM